jgi:hypothetical protein
MNGFGGLRRTTPDCQALLAPTRGDQQRNEELYDLSAIIIIDRSAPTTRLLCRKIPRVVSTDAAKHVMKLDGCRQMLGSLGGACVRLDVGSAE